MTLIKGELITGFNARASSGGFTTQLIFNTSEGREEKLGQGLTGDSIGGGDAFDDTTGYTFVGLDGYWDSSEIFYTGLKPVAYETECLNTYVSDLGDNFGWTLEQIETKTAANAEEEAEDEITNVLDTAGDVLEAEAKELKDMEEERDLFFILTIVFAVLFILSMIFAIVMMMKIKRTKERNFVTNHVTEQTQLVDQKNVSTSQIDISKKKDKQ